MTGVLWDLCDRSIAYNAALKITTFAMPETSENWRDLVNSFVYYAHQTHKIYQVPPYSVDFKAPMEL